MLSTGWVQRELAGTMGCEGHPNDNSAKAVRAHTPAATIFGPKSLEGSLRHHVERPQMLQDNPACSVVSPSVSVKKKG